MTARVFWSWQDDDDTFDLSRRENGIIPPGLYRGYDPNFSVMDLTLDHAVTGFQDTQEDQTLSAKFGVVKTPQGSVIQDPDSHLLPISVGDATHPRIDTIYLEHIYVETVGGTQPSFAVVEGTPAATPVAPSVPSPEIQVKLGELYVPANCTDLGTTTGVVYTRAKLPTYANGLGTFADLTDVDFVSGGVPSGGGIMEFLVRRTDPVTNVTTAWIISDLMSVIQSNRFYPSRTVTEKQGSLYTKRTYGSMTVPNYEIVYNDDGNYFTLNVSTNEVIHDIKFYDKDNALGVYDAATGTEITVKVSTGAAPPTAAYLSTNFNLNFTDYLGVSQHIGPFSVAYLLNNDILKLRKTSTKWDIVSWDSSHNRNLNVVYGIILNVFNFAAWVSMPSSTSGAAVRYASNREDATLSGLQYRRDGRGMVVMRGGFKVTGSLSLTILQSTLGTSEYWPKKQMLLKVTKVASSVYTTETVTLDSLGTLQLTSAPTLNDEYYFDGVCYTTDS